MIPLLEILFLIALFFGISAGLTYLSYQIPNKLGYPKIGRSLSFVAGLVCFFVAVSVVFEDQLFSRTDARKLINLQGIQLKEDFELLKNESMSAPGDYYHTFTLKISEREKERIISQIRSSKQFRNLNDSVQNIFQLTDRYLGEPVIQNFETDGAFVRRTLRPAGEINYAPLFHVITVCKRKNELRFEDIVE